jgi:hypothetical protein
MICSPSCAPANEASCGAQQRQRLLGCPKARREKMLVKIEKDHQ